MASLRPERLGLEDFADQPIDICGKSFRAHFSGALYWPSQNALIISGVALGEPSSLRAGGSGFPLRSTAETLRALALAIDTYDAATVISLGDGAPEGGTAGAMSTSERETLAIIQEDREWIWVAPHAGGELCKRLGGAQLPELTIEGIRICHRPRRGDMTHEVAGFLNPAARLVMHGTAIRRPCFVGNGRRLIMPSFGGAAGGLNILDAAFEPIFGTDGMTVWMIGQDGVYPVAARSLREDSAAVNGQAAGT